MRKKFVPVPKDMDTVFGIVHEVELARCTLNIHPECTGYSDGGNHYANSGRDLETGQPESVGDLRGACIPCYNLQCKKNRERKKVEESSLAELID